MQKIVFKLALVLITILLSVQLTYAQTPNFIVILVDDQGWTGTSVQMDANDASSKSDFYSTPNLEQLAANGMTFSQAYAPAAKCSPSRNAILLGKSTARTQFTTTSSGGTTTGDKLIEASSNTSINSSDTTIAEWLKDAGLNYRTAHYGKWHLGNGGPSSHGFDYGSGNTDNDDGNAADGLTIQDDPKKMYELTDSAINFMTSAVDDGTPFYLQISHYAVHTAIEGTTSQINAYNNTTVGSNHDDPEYAAMTENLDSAVGLIMSEVAALGITGTTYIIYTSDNGASNGVSSNSPLTRGKTFIYEGGIRVPFIMQGPNITANTRSDDPIVGYDLMPTIATLSGSTNDLPYNIDGENIANIWNGAGFTRSAPMYFHIPHYESNINKTPRSAIRDGNYKLIVEYETGNNYLYDLSTDKEEDVDIASSNTALVESMRKELRDHFETVEANMPTLDETHADFSGTGTDVDGDGLEDAWELRRALAHTFGPTDNIDGDIATFQEEHDYNSDPLTDEGLSATDASLNLDEIYMLESAGDTTIAIAFPVTNSTGGDLTVNYTVSGTATAGVDYTALSGSVTVANGVNKMDITLSITDDLDDESDETIIITLNSSSGVGVGTIGTFTLTIADNECVQDALDPTLRNCTVDYTTDGLNESYAEVTDTVADTRAITTTGVPNHDYRAPNIAEIPATYTIDLTPALSGTTYTLLGESRIQGNFGQAINGVKVEPIAAEPFENPNTGEQNWDWVLDFPSSPGDLSSDCNYAHQQSNGEYHYHGDMVGLANTLLSGLGDGTTTPTYPIQVGWAADGFPVYYKYGYATPTDSTTGIVEYTANYALQSGSRPGDGISAPCGTYNGKYMQDYEYNASNGGDLDDCNGVFGVTREFPAGIYYYVITSSYPFIPRCLKGTPSTDYFSGTILPVELTRFTGQVQNENDVVLKWTTSSETNNRGFEILKSRDWENWETLTFVEGAGMSLEPINYTYTDNDVSYGEIYYKLKQIDHDGTSEFSQTIVVEIDKPNADFKLYPNPTTGNLNYRLDADIVVEEVYIFNIYGQVVKHQHSMDNTISVANLPTGVYFVVLALENGELLKEKVIKQ